MHCLVVDDQVEDAELVGRLLAGAGLRVTCLDGGYAAIGALHGETPYDVVVLDYQMPEMNGAQVVEAIRGLAPRIPIVIVSGSSEQGHVLAALRAGACGYIVKDDAAALLVHAVLQARDGGATLSPAVATHVLRALRNGPSPRQRSPSVPLARLDTKP